VRPVESSELVELAERVARAAGDAVRARRADGVPGTSTKSTVTDMVTELDRASEAIVVSSLLDARPDDAIVGEEGADLAGTSGISWLVDPIDGTTNLLYDMPGWAVSIAAADASGTVAAVVYVPTFGELFCAVRGGGAHLNGRPISCRDRGDLATALIGTGFAYRAEKRAQQGQLAARLLPLVRDLRRFGAAAVDLCSVACGRLDAYYEEGLAPWDLAAGALIAHEAGAVLTDLDGGPVRPASVLVAGPTLHPPLLRLLRRLTDETTGRAAEKAPAGPPREAGEVAHPHVGAG
jgi:myo-inositol-1(or 4)-monophosphatase